MAESEVAEREGWVFVITFLLMRFPHFSTTLLLLISLLPACGSANRLLKAGGVEPTAFFKEPWLAQDGGNQLPFHKLWTTRDPQVLTAGMKRRKLHIAPVSLSHLRPVRRSLSAQEVAWGVRRQEAEVAARLREEFVGAFRRSPQPYYRLADRPGRDTLTLQLALVELQPTSPKGNAVLTVLKFAVTPVAALGRMFTKGNIAIEGRVVLSDTGRVFFQFADNEHDKLTFLSTRDYQPYGHAVNTMRNWAVQFEKMTRTPRGTRVGDSSTVTLRTN